jgi:hypothetical protein
VAPDFGVTAGSTGMGGTMGATGTSTQQLTKRRSAGNPPSKPLPRHEMFLVNSTVVEVTAELHRALLPSTLADAVAASAALEGAHKEKGRARANATAAAASSPGANKSKGWSFFFLNQSCSSFVCAFFSFFVCVCMYVCVSLPFLPSICT